MATSLDLKTIKAPFPWFGGKSKVASIVWERFGDVLHYIEPFAGSLAVLLGRPYPPRIETVNDKDAFLANFWRALCADPDSVAFYADWPINEIDLHARHEWLAGRLGHIEKMRDDPDYYDAKIAGWWVWGLCQWIGSGWCSGSSGKNLSRQRPHLLGKKGINSADRGDIYPYFQDLAKRLRYVRVCCGDWSRVVTPSVTCKYGLTGIFLDPPYGEKSTRKKDIYSEDSFSVAGDVREWAIANGDNSRLRIAICGYEGEYEMPSEWEKIEWKASGGYSTRNSRGIDNRHKERIWFSPHCLKV